MTEPEHHEVGGEHPTEHADHVRLEERGEHEERHRSPRRSPSTKDAREAEAGRERREGVGLEARRGSREEDERRERQRVDGDVAATLARGAHRPVGHPPEPRRRAEDASHRGHELRGDQRDERLEQRRIGLEGQDGDRPVVRHADARIDEPGEPTTDAARRVPVERLDALERREPDARHREGDAQREGEAGKGEAEDSCRARHRRAQGPSSGARAGVKARKPPAQVVSRTCRGGPCRR